MVRLQTRTRIQKLSKFDSAANTRRAGGVILYFLGEARRHQAYRSGPEMRHVSSVSSQKISLTGELTTDLEARELTKDLAHTLNPTLSLSVSYSISHCLSCCPPAPSPC